MASSSGRAARRADCRRSRNPPIFTHGLDADITEATDPPGGAISVLDAMLMNGRTSLPGALRTAANAGSATHEENGGEGQSGACQHIGEMMASHGQRRNDHGRIQEQDRNEEPARIA